MKYLLLFLSGMGGMLAMFLLICYTPEIVDMLNFFRRKKEAFTWEEKSK